MPKVSIVIPVYNTADYLRECLDSVINQTLNDIEIIIVNDGSTDGSTEICREYLQKDKRIKLIEQENMGVAAARKNGILLATGKYIGFVDADDYIDADMYETFLEHIADCDLLTSSCYMEQSKWEDMLPAGSYKNSSEMQFVRENMMWMKSIGQKGFTTSICNKLFLTAFTKQVFESIKTDIFCGEDSEFLFRYILLCESVSITKLCKYHYRWRENSAVHTSNDKYLENVSNLYLSLKDAFQYSQNRDHLMEQLQHFILDMLLKAPRMMGFSLNARFVEYVYPQLLSNQRIALYGAGAVGQSYYTQLVKEKNPPVIWVDKRYTHYQEQFPVQSVESLLDMEFDILIIAVLREELAEQIKYELVSYGIEEKKIIWKKPIHIV